MCPFPVLYSLFTNNCVSYHASVKLVKFALEGLVTNSDKSEYRHEVNRLVSWCDNNNLQLNASKTRQLTVDFTKKKTPIASIIINGELIERAVCFTFLGTTIYAWHGKITQKPVMHI